MGFNGLAYISLHSQCRRAAQGSTSRAGVLIASALAGGRLPARSRASTGWSVRWQAGPGDERSCSGEKRARTHGGWARRGPLPTAPQAARGMRLLLVGNPCGRTLRGKGMPVREVRAIRSWPSARIWERVDRVDARFCLPGTGAAYKTC